MALSKVNFNSLNLTPTASKTVVFNSSNNGIEAGDVGGSMVLISELTASSSATLSFTSGIDSTYKEYIFKFIDIHPSSTDVNGESFKFNFSIDGGSNYNVTKTSTAFKAYHEEAGNYTGLRYETSDDLAQSTGYQYIGTMIANAGDDTSLSGYLHLFDPSNTTFVKHFIGTSSQNSTYANHITFGGYGNTTSAINAIDFKAISGTLDSGTIDLYGVK